MMSVLLHNDGSFSFIPHLQLYPFAWMGQIYNVAYIVFVQLLHGTGEVSTGEEHTL